MPERPPAAAPRPIVDGAPDVLELFDRDLRLIDASPLFEGVTGIARTAALGRRLDELALPRRLLETRSGLLRQVLETERPATVEFAMEGPSGPRWFESRAAPSRGPGGAVTGIVMATRDITDRLGAREELARASRVEAMTALIAEVAHDINNMLTAILGNVGLARGAAQRGAAAAETDADERLAAAEEAAQRARGLARQLLSLARGGEPVRRPTELAPLLEEAARAALRGRAVDLDLAVAPGLWPASADPVQIGQVVHNLVLNAAQAMPGGGTVAVRAENQFDLSFGESPPSAATPSFVRVTVRDDGAGIAPADRARVFDPFFTTRPYAAGLGLSEALAVVRRHDGMITLESEPGVGTTVSFCLPAVRGAPERAPGPVAGAATTPARRVLVMDDERLIRDLVGLFLRKRGIAVVLAGDGREAVDLFGAALARGERFDAVLLDLTIPGGRGGADVIRELRELDPDVCGIVTSGYANDPVMVRHRDHGFRAALAKPFDGEQLVRTLAATWAEANGG